MRKWGIWCICLILALGLCACGRKAGDVSSVQTHEVASELYTQEDIDAAMAVIEEVFAADFSGCTLTELYYAGDEETIAHEDWAARINGDEVLVLLSSFDVDSSGGDGSLNPNSTYEGWNWILVRTNGGQWQHVDHGY